MRIGQAQCFVAPHRLYPMHERLDTLLFEECTKVITPSSSNHVVLITVVMSSLVKVGQREISYAFESCAITGCNLPAMANPAREVPQLDVEHRGVNVVEERCIAVVMIL